MAETGTNTGLFNFQSILKQFYNWSPDSDDTAGQALKNTFLADNVQSVLNSQMSKELAYTNAEIATGQMTDAAKLELANTSMIMEDEFNYGMQKMGAEYDYQSKFAVDEANRNLNAAAQAGDIQQNQTKLEGEQNRLNITSQGQVDKDNINTQGNVDINKIGAQGQVDENKIEAQGDQDVRKIDAQGFMEQELTKVKGKEDRKTIVGQGDQDVRKIQTTGSEERKNMMQKTTEEDKTAARQSKYARGLAGMF